MKFKKKNKDKDIENDPDVEKDGSVERMDITDPKKETIKRNKIRSERKFKQRDLRDKRKRCGDGM